MTFVTADDASTPLPFGAPTLLLVDDKPDDAEDLIELFRERGGFDVVVARSRSEAQRRLVSEPGIEAMSTDISLESEGVDIVGAELAAEVASTTPTLPVGGYSGYRSLDALPEHLRAAFDLWVEKGDSVEVLLKYVDDLRARAFQYRSLRDADPAQQLADRGRSLAGNQLIELIGGTEVPVSSPRTVRQLLKDRGYELRAVVPVLGPESRLRVIAPIACWTRRATKAAWEGEVLGQPFFYATGRSEQEVLAKLAELVVLFAESLGVDHPSDQHAEHSGPARDLASYLQTVLGRSSIDS